MKTYLIGITATFAFAVALAANGYWRFIPDCAWGAFLVGGLVAAGVMLCGGLLVMGGIMKEGRF